MPRLSVTVSLTAEARSLADARGTRRARGGAHDAREGPLHGRAAGGTEAVPMEWVLTSGHFRELRNLEFCPSFEE